MPLLPLRHAQLFTIFSIFMLPFFRFRYFFDRLFFFFDFRFRIIAIFRYDITISPLRHYCWRHIFSLPLFSPIMPLPLPLLIRHYAAAKARDDAR
jgi:hypothetical protein